MRRRHPVLWLRAHPRAADSIMAALLAAAGVAGLWLADTTGLVDVRDPNGWAALLALIMTLPLALRRERPATVVLITSAALVISQLARFADTVSTLGILVAVYSLAAHGRPRLRAYWVGIIFAGGLGAFTLLGILRREQGATFWNLVGNYVVFGTAFILGDNLHRRRQRVTDLEARARDLEHTRDLETERAVSDERARIARDLHDVIAHSISVMVVQAGAARRIIQQDPQRAEAAIAQVEQTGRESLTEMRRLLGVLRSPDGQAELAPQPTLSDLLALTASDPTVPVSLQVGGESRPLAPAVEMSAYRIIQEALTNIRKHAGVTSAEVSIDYAERGLDIVVADRGRGASASLAMAAGRDGLPDAGHGLLGMRERAALVGGELLAGPQSGGGWIVRARLPYEGRGA